MPPPIKLAERVKATPDRQAAVITLLETALEHARAGEHDTALLISRAPDGTWQWDFAGEAYTAETVGRLEIVKHELVSKFLHDMS